MSVAFRRRLHASLAITTVLAGIGMTSRAMAQTVRLPSGNDATVRGTSADGSPFGGFARPGISRSGQTLTVDLRTGSTVIDWNGFNVPDGATARFNDDRSAFGGRGGQMAVLNRDVSGVRSQILGTLTADSNVAVWLLNPKGILVGPGARINTGSLVLSTLDTTTSEFLANDFRLRLGSQSNAASLIEVQGNAQLTVTGGNRGLVLVAPSIQASGSFQAGGDQDVAFVTATDVTLSYQTGSPLSVTINAGTSVPGRSQFVRGTVGGRSALFALASQQTVTDALLGVDASVTTAVAGSRGIVLLAGATPSGTSGVTITGSAATGGAANIAMGGLLTATGAGTNVAVRASRDATVTGGIASSGNVTIAAGANATAGGNVSAGRRYEVSGTSVTLGGPGDVVQRAAEAATVTASTGSITGLAGLTLQSDGNGAGVNPLTLEAGSAGSGVNLAPSTTLLGGTALQSDVRVRTGTRDAAFVLGNVRARDLLTAVGPESFTSGITRSGSVSLGNVQIARGLTLGATDVVIGGLDATGGSVEVNASGNATLGAVRSGSAVTLTAGRGLDVGTIDAVGDVRLAANGVRAPAAAPGGGDDPASAIGNSVRLRGNVTAGGALSVNAFDSFASAANLAAAGTLTVVSGGIASLGGGAAVGGNLSIDAGDATLGGNIAARGAVDVRARSGIIGAPNLILTADSDAAGAEMLSLTAGTGTVALASESRLVGGQERGSVVSVSSGQGLTLGAVDARALTLAGAAPEGKITTGELLLTDALVLAAAGGIETGGVTVTEGGLTLDAGAAPLTLGALNLAGSTTLTGDSITTGDIVTPGLIMTARNGGIAAGRVAVAGSVGLSATGGGVTTVSLDATAGDVNVTGTGNLDLGTVTASGTATLSTIDAPADILLSGGLTAVEAVTLTSTRDIRATSVISTDGDLILSAPNGMITGYLPGTRASLAAGPGKRYLVDARYAVSLGDVRGGPVRLRAESISATSIDVGNEVIDLHATAGDLTIETFARGGTVNLSATGNLALGEITANDSLTLAGGKSLSFRSLNGSSVSGTSDGAITGGVVVSPGDVTLAGASVTLDGITASGRASVDARAGLLTIGNVTARGGLTGTSAGTLSIGTMSSEGGETTLRSGGDASIGNVTVRGGLTGTSEGTLSIGTLSSEGGETILRSGGAASIGNITARGGLTGTSAGTLSIGTLSSEGGGAILRSGGDASIGSATLRGDLDLVAGGAAGVSGNVAIDGGYAVQGRSVMLGGGAGVQQRATGPVTLTATGGDLNGAAGLTLAGAGDIALSATGGIGLGESVLAPAGVLGVRAGAGSTIALGQVRARSIGTLGANGGIGDLLDHDGRVVLGDLALDRLAVRAREIQLGRLTTSGDVRLAASGAVRTGDLSATTLDIVAGDALTGGAYTAVGDASLSGGSLELATLSAGRELKVATTGALSIEGVTARADAALRSSGGAVRLGTIEAAGLTTIEGSAVAADRVRSGSIAVTSNGDVAARSGGRSALTTTAGDLSIKAGGNVLLAGSTAAGAATIDAGTIDAAGSLVAGRGLTLRARGAARFGTVEAGGDLTANANGLSAELVRGRGALSLTSGGDLALDAAEVGGSALIDAAGTARLGRVAAGPSLTIRASDAELNGAQRAASVRVENRAGDSRAMRLGDGTGTDGFRLSAVEVARIEADALVLAQGKGDLEIGTLGFGAEAGRRSVDVLGTGTIRVSGAVSGAGRRFRIGGSTDASANAGDLIVEATPTGGGRLLFGDADLELRGDRIGVGLAGEFLNTLATPGGAAALVGNSNSALYNANLGGSFYAPEANVTLAARSLTVRYADYALFQNTAVAGLNGGVVLGGTPAAPVAPALTLMPNSGAGSSSFALFGTINGVGGTDVGTLGPDVVSFGNASRASTRINGCLAGAGGDCLRTVAIQPRLQVFDQSRDDVFGVASDLAVPFDPLIGGNNEELLTGLDLLASGASNGCAAGEACLPTNTGAMGTEQ